MQFLSGKVNLLFSLSKGTSTVKRLGILWEAMAFRAKGIENKCSGAHERGRAFREDMLVRILVLSNRKNRTQSDMRYMIEMIEMG